MIAERIRNSLEKKEGGKDQEGAGEGRREGGGRNIKEERQKKKTLRIFCLQLENQNRDYKELRRKYKRKRL